MQMPEFHTAFIKQVGIVHDQVIGADGKMGKGRIIERILFLMILHGGSFQSFSTIYIVRLFLF